MESAPEAPKVKSKPEQTDGSLKFDWEALLAYIPVFCLYPWSLRKSRPDLLRHARQGMILFSIELVLILITVPLIYRLLWLGVIVLAVVGLISVLNGKPYRLPVFAELYDRIFGPSDRQGESGG